MADNRLDQLIAQLRESQEAGQTMPGMIELLEERRGLLPEDADQAAVDEAVQDCVKSYMSQMTLSALGDLGDQLEKLTNQPGRRSAAAIENYFRQYHIRYAKGHERGLAALFNVKFPANRCVMDMTVAVNAADRVVTIKAEYPFRSQAIMEYPLSLKLSEINSRLTLGCFYYDPISLKVTYKCAHLMRGEITAAEVSRLFAAVDGLTAAHYQAIKSIAYADISSADKKAISSKAGLLSRRFPAQLPRNPFARNDDDDDDDEELAF